MALGVVSRKFTRGKPGKPSMIDGMPVVNLPGDVFFVDTRLTGGDGSSWTTAFNTVQKALNAIVQDYTTIYVTGNPKEQVSVPAFNYCRLIGVSDSPRGVKWQAPSSPAATTPLLTLKKIGWTVSGFLFNAPTDAAAIQVFRDATFNAQDSIIEDCEFNTGAIAIESKGGSPNVIVRNNRIHDMTSGSVGTPGAIISTSTAQALPQRWFIHDNLIINNKNHIVMPLKIGIIKNNVICEVGDSITATAAVVLTGGDHNLVTGNMLTGTYANGALYAPGTTDNWNGNAASTGFTAAVPA